MCKTRKNLCDSQGGGVLIRPSCTNVANVEKRVEIFQYSHNCFDPDVVGCDKSARWDITMDPEIIKGLINRVKS
jgi:hypothetical protein